ncbi:hypothetical protein ACU686_04415 [Yinghuangia aomiensis]
MTVTGKDVGSGLAGNVGDRRRGSARPDRHAAGGADRLAASPACCAGRRRTLVVDLADRGIILDGRRRADPGPGRSGAVRDRGCRCTWRTIRICGW